MPGVSGQPGQPRPAVPQGEGVDTGEEVVGGPLVALHSAPDEGTDLTAAVGRGWRLVVTHRSMVHPARPFRRTPSVVVH
ncbi:hypothetical protein GCM10023079_07210 [Streptomyces chitinivorans]